MDVDESSPEVPEELPKEPPKEPPKEKELEKDKKDSLNKNDELQKFVKPEQRLRFNPQKNITIFGPTQSGKTSFNWKLFIDGWQPVNEGEAPFDIGYYVGNENPAKELPIAMATMGYTYSNQMPNSSNKQAFYIPKVNLNELEANLKSELNRNKKKIVIFDDMIMQNDNKVNNTIASLMQQGQHLNSTFIAISHNPAGPSIKSIRDASTYFVFCNCSENDIRTATKVKVSTDTLSKYFHRLKLLENPYDRVIIWDGNQFYDKNLYPIL